MICQANGREVVARAMQEAAQFAPDLQAAHILNSICLEFVEFEIVAQLRAIRNEFGLNPPFESQRAKDALLAVAAMLQQIEEIDAQEKAKLNMRVPA